MLYFGHVLVEILQTYIYIYIYVYTSSFYASNFLFYFHWLLLAISKFHVGLNQKDSRCFEKELINHQLANEFLNYSKTKIIKSVIGWIISNKPNMFVMTKYIKLQSKRISDQSINTFTFFIVYQIRLWFQL